MPGKCSCLFKSLGALTQLLPGIQWPRSKCITHWTFVEPEAICHNHMCKDPLTVEPIEEVNCVFEGSCPLMA